MRGFFVSLFVLLSVITNALPVNEITIKGFINSLSKKPYGNQTVKVQVIDDFITFHKETIASVKTGVHGDFDVKFSLNKTALVFIIFNKVERTLFVEPGKSYFLEVKAPIENLAKSAGYMTKDVQSAEIMNRHSQEINTLLDSLENTCSYFLANNVSDRKNGKKMEAFVDKLTQQFSNVKSTYFQEYLQYKGAELMFYFYRSRRADFAKKYLDSEKDLSNNIQKMQVFSSFFNEHLKVNILINDKHPFHSAFKKGNLTEVLSHIYLNPSASKEIRELILLKGISEIYNQKFFTQQQFNLVLDRLIESTSFTNHIKIANNLKRKINHLKEGFPADNIVIDKEKFTLYDIRGKYIYLCFFKAQDESFKQELIQLEQLANQFKTQLQIVCISTDLELKAYQVLKAQYQSKFKFVHYNYQNDILNNYAIEDFRVDRYDKETTSMYYLINPQRNLVYSPANAPSKGFAKDFQRLMAE